MSDSDTPKRCRSRSRTPYPFLRSICDGKQCDHPQHLSESNDSNSSTDPTYTKFSNEFSSLSSNNTSATPNSSPHRSRVIFHLSEEATPNSTRLHQKTYRSKIFIQRKSRSISSRSSGGLFNGKLSTRADSSNGCISSRTSCQSNYCNSPKGFCSSPCCYCSTGSSGYLKNASFLHPSSVDHSRKPNRIGLLPGVSAMSNVFSHIPPHFTKTNLFSSTEFAENIQKFLKDVGPQHLVLVIAPKLVAKTLTILRREENYLVVDFQMMLMPEHITEDELEWQVDHMNKNPQTFTEGFSDADDEMEHMEMSIMVAERIIFVRRLSKLSLVGKTSYFSCHSMTDICPVKLRNDFGHLNMNDLYGSTRDNKTISRREVIVISFGQRKMCTIELQKTLMLAPAVSLPTGQELHLDESFKQKGDTLFLERNMALANELWFHPIGWKKELNGLYYISLGSKPVRPERMSQGMQTELPMTPKERATDTVVAPPMSVIQNLSMLPSKSTPKVTINRNIFKPYALTRVLDKSQTSVTVCTTPKALQDTPKAPQLNISNKNQPNSVRMVGPLATIPKSQIAINVPFNKPSIHYLVLKNEGTKPLAWALKTNRSKIFNAEPHNGIIEKQKSIRLLIRFNGLTEEENTSPTDRVIVTWTEVEPGTSFCYELFQRNEIIVAKKILAVNYNY